MSRRLFLTTLFWTLLVLCIESIRFWGPELRTLYRDGKRVRMYQLKPGDVIWVSSSMGDPANHSTWKVTSHPYLSSSLVWGVDVLPYDPNETMPLETYAKRLSKLTPHDPVMDVEKINVRGRS